MYNLDEYFNIKINHEDDFKAMKIKDDIKQKDEIYKKLNENMDELFPIMEKISVCLKNISQNLLNLKNIYGDGHKCNETLSYCYQQLYQQNHLFRFLPSLPERNNLLRQHKHPYFSFLHDEASVLTFYQQC